MLLFMIRHWKSVLVFLVLVASWFSFLSTDMLSDAGIDRYLESLYFAINLFIVGALDIGFPRGGPLAALITLWICYFLAPLLTISIVYHFIQEKIFSRLLPQFKDHTIICGLGRNGKLIYELVKSYSPKRHRIVIIEKDANNAYRELLSRDRNTWWIKNDFTKLPVLLKARIQTAARVFLTTNLDLANLNALVEILEVKNKATNFKTFCHLGDLNLHANFEATIFQERKFAEVILFNGYQCVTRRLYENWIKERDLLSPNGNIFIILGFGKFGQMLFSHLILDEQRTSKDEIFITTIQSRSTFDLEKLQYRLNSQRMEEVCKVHKPVFLDMNSPELWLQLAKLDRLSKKQMFIFACSDNDIANLNLAISMKLNGPPRLNQATIFCRMYSRTATEINIILEQRITRSQPMDVILFPLQDELKEAFRRDLFQ